MDQLTLDDALVVARARSSDPWTSHAAARSVNESDLRARQQAILSLFRNLGPMHHDRLIETYFAWRMEPHQSISGLRTRTRELVDLGFLRNSGQTVLLPSGRHSIVWEAVGKEGVEP